MEVKEKSLSERALMMAEEALRVSREFIRRVRHIERIVNFMSENDHLYYASIGFQYDI